MPRTILKSASFTEVMGAKYTIKITSSSKSQHFLSERPQMSPGHFDFHETHTAPH